MKKIVLFTVALFMPLAACGNRPCYENNYQTLKRYPVNFSMTTASGVAVDPTGQPVDLEKIDQQLAELEQCLTASFAETPTITPELAAKADCRENGAGRKTEFGPVNIGRDCLKVKIPDDWFVLPCSKDEELLPIPAANSLCEAKGLAAECPCYWRVETQDNNTIVTPPNLKLFKAEVARMVTGCNNVWLIPQITACLK